MTSVTSIAAYDAVKPKISRLHTQILTCLREVGPQTASELMDRTGVLYNTLWRRLSELKDAGLVINTDEQRKNSRNRSETVVKAV